MNIRAVIMAGGSGTRFWPLSRKARPKQFLDIVSPRSMIEETVARLFPLIPPKDIFTIAVGDQTAALRDLLTDLPKRNFLVEPLARNTAPSLMLATAHAYLQDPETVIAALAADHLIRDPGRFLKKLQAGAKAAYSGDRIVTFGIPPAFPSTGYGYIHFSREKRKRIGGEPFFPVLEFKEKPGRAEAERFLADGNYFWNSGMFLWRADVFARKLRKYAPRFFPFWERLLDALAKKSPRKLRSVFEEIPALSIDYALMEKAKGVVVCTGDFGWSDVGAWSSLYEVWPPDEAGNAVKGETIVLDAQGCLVYAPGKLTALVGVKDLIVIDAGDSLLICRKDQDQKVKDIVDILKNDRKKYL